MVQVPDEEETLLPGGEHQTSLLERMSGLPIECGEGEAVLVRVVDAHPGIAFGAGRQNVDNLTTKK